MAFREICVVGSGRVGHALAARLRQRGLRVRTTTRELTLGSAELVLLCVPDGEIARVARRIEPGPWVAHVSGATPLAALDPHRRRFGVHPLQTFTRARGAEQIDGAYAAVTAETDAAREHGFDLARTLGLRPFELADADRPLYHAAAAIASNYLVTLYRAAAGLFAEVGAPAEGLTLLMRRTIENEFELTGPIARGDRLTVEAHRQTLAERAPELVEAYRVLADLTARLDRPQEPARA
jgi:predicted short-subunit dehydrogenase-like oxidoreductase (DUF2520 family)